VGKELCDLSDKLLPDEFKAYAKLVKKPRYICRKCGRAARKKKNLCKPQKIKK
jgi:hypothetical protein